MSLKKLLIALAIGLSGVFAGCNSLQSEAGTLVAPTPSSTQTAARAPQTETEKRRKDEENRWANRTGLTEDLVRQLRIRSGLDDEDAGIISNIDTQSLADRNQILFVSSGGNGGCLAVSVFDVAKEFEKVWSISGAADGSGFCRQSPINPSAYVEKQKRIVIEIPTYDYVKRSKGRSVKFLYQWNGRSYEPIAKYN